MRVIGRVVTVYGWQLYRHRVDISSHWPFHHRRLHLVPWHGFVAVSCQARSGNYDDSVTSVVCHCIVCDDEQFLQFAGLGFVTLGPFHW